MIKFWNSWILDMCFPFLSATKHAFVFFFFFIVWIFAEKYMFLYMMGEKRGPGLFHVIRIKRLWNWNLWIDSGPSWSKLRWTASSWKGAVRIWRRRTGGCRRKFRSLEHWNFPRNSTCTWPHPQPSPCAHLVSVSLFHHPPLMPRVVIQWPQPTLGPYPLAHGLPLLPSLQDPSMSFAQDRDVYGWWKGRIGNLTNKYRRKRL